MKAPNTTTMLCVICGFPEIVSPVVRRPLPSPYVCRWCRTERRRGTLASWFRSLPAGAVAVSYSPWFKDDVYAREFGA